MVIKNKHSAHNTKIGVNLGSTWLSPGKFVSFEIIHYLFQIFNFVDFILTYFLVIQLGVPEGNPIVNILIQNYGTYGLASIKIVAATAAYFIYVQGYRQSLNILTALYAVLCVYHLYYIGVITSIL